MSDPRASTTVGYTEVEFNEGLEEAHANAAFIVRACNAHDALVSALRGIVSAHEEFRAQLPDDWDGDPLSDRIEDALAALALATGVPQLDPAVSETDLAGLATDAARYRYLRERDLDTIDKGGVFAGMTPKNVVLNLEDLDRAVDAAMAQQFDPPGTVSA